MRLSLCLGSASSGVELCRSDRASSDPAGVHGEHGLRRRRYMYDRRVLQLDLPKHAGRLPFGHSLPATDRRVRCNRVHERR